MHSSWTVLPEEEQDREFDGEAYIERRISGWEKQDVVLAGQYLIYIQRWPISKYKQSAHLDLEDL
jgi:hypothetical protein